MSDRPSFLPHLNSKLIERAYRNAAGNEFETGKMMSAESSAALVANAFGLFVDWPEGLPALPGTDDFDWPASSVRLEACVRFPWRGGRHPWLDVLVETPTHLIGIESKRFEPYRVGQSKGFSKAYWRSVWGEQMRQVEALRDSIRDGDKTLTALDATQLVKHMFGLRSEAHRRKPPKGAALVYLYAEPTSWPDGREILPAEHAGHATCVDTYATRVAGAEVSFHCLTYKRLLSSWIGSSSTKLQSHAEAIGRAFSPL